MGFLEGLLGGLQPAPGNIASTILRGWEGKKKATAAIKGQKLKMAKEEAMNHIAAGRWDKARELLMETGMSLEGAGSLVETAQSDVVSKMPYAQAQQRFGMGYDKQAGGTPIVRAPTVDFPQGSTFTPREEGKARTIPSDIVQRVMQGRGWEGEAAMEKYAEEGMKTMFKKATRSRAEQTFALNLKKEARMQAKALADEKHRTTQRRQKAMAYVHGSFMDSMKMVASGAFTPRQGLSALHNTIAMVNDAYGLDMSRPGASTPIVLAEKMYDQFALRGLMGNQISDIGGTRNIQSQAAYIVDKLKDPAVAKALGTLAEGGQGMLTAIQQWYSGGAEAVIPQALTDFMFSLGYLEDDIKRMKSGLAVTEQEGAFYKELIGSLYTDPTALETRMFSLIHKFQLRVDGQYQATIDNKFSDPTERQEYYDRIPQFTFKNGMTIAHVIALREHGLKIKD